MPNPSIKPEEFYELRSDVKVLANGQTRLESQANKLESLKLICYVIAGVSTALGLSGAAFGTYAVKKLSELHTNETQLEAQIADLKTNMGHITNAIDSYLAVAETNFDRYATQHIPQALADLRLYGIKDLEFTDDGGKSKTPQHAINKQGSEIWVPCGHSIKGVGGAESTNYLIIKRPD